MKVRVVTIAASVSVAILSALGAPPVVPVIQASQRPTAVPSVAGQRGTGPSEIATLIQLPSLGRNLGAEARAVNDDGTVVVGQAWDRGDQLWAVFWTQQNGAWSIHVLPTPPDATSAAGRAFSVAGAAGHDYPASRSRALFWPWTGGFNLLGCNDDVGPASVYAASADGQLVAGQEASRASVWPTAIGSCRVDLPLPAANAGGGARAVNGDGTIVGGTAGTVAGFFPVRWIFNGAAWSFEPLDNRTGSVAGMNGVGDAAGSVHVTNGYAGCVLQDGCTRAVIWPINGPATELGTLGGAHSDATDVNSNGEATGNSVSPQAGSVPYVWSPSFGMIELPSKGQGAAAWAISDVRPDGTRVVVGLAATRAAVWVVRNP